MLETIIHYLRRNSVPFKLASYPSEESEPKAGHVLSPHAVLADTRIALIDGAPVIVGLPHGSELDYEALGQSIGGLAEPGTIEALPSEFHRLSEPVPPLGQLFGLPLVLDERVSTCGLIVFRVFGESDYVEVPMDDFCRLEQPRIVTFTGPRVTERRAS